jgi:hypothetical protein
MSFLTFAKRNRVCLTCSCWAGTRTVISNNASARAEPSDTKGECNSLASPRRGVTLDGASSCSKWDAWGAMK